jgi:ElaB/YqjD/DUF883 family membrane-anchored ribosome-binding protein
MDTPATTPSDASEAQRQRLAQGLQDMVEEGERLLRAARSSGSEHLSDLHDKLELQLQHARRELHALGETAAHNVRRAAHAADTAVHQHPYAAIGLAAGVGVLIGMLISRR